jgi:crossover junction endodeoxyribonuclease RuvC
VTDHRNLYLGIDPGVKNCALVAFSPDRGLVLTWKPTDPDIPGGVQRLCYLMHYIKGQLDVLGKQGTIRGIAMEGYSMYERFGQHNSGEVGAAIKLTLVGWFGLDKPIAYPTLVAPQQLKKFTSGSGNSKKSMMAKEVLKRWGADFNDDNLADAYALARVAYAIDARPAMPVFQQQVVDALKGRSEWEPQRQPGPISPGGERVTTGSSSESPPRATRVLLRGRSMSPSTGARPSNSEPSVRRRLIRR